MPTFAKPGLYARVLILSIVVLALMIALPEGDVWTAVVVVLEGLLLITVLKTAEAPHAKSLTYAAAAAAVLAAGTAISGTVPTWLSVGIGGLMILAALAALLHGAAQLLRTHGVTPQLVCAGLAVYVVLGVLFANVIGAVATATHGYYFSQHTDGDTSDRVYFSFVTLTTTGYGDLTPANQFGRALAVCEVLIGEIYLLTVVSLLVSNLRPARGPQGGDEFQPVAAGGAAALPGAAAASPPAAAGPPPGAAAPRSEPPLPPPD